MKRLLILPILLLALSFTGCAGTINTTTGAPVSATEQAQDNATNTVVSIGQVIYTARASIKNARTAGLIKTKEAYNEAVDIYNMALSSYTLLNKALQDALKAGIDPVKDTAYLTAMSNYLTDKDVLTSLMSVLGVK